MKQRSWVHSYCKEKFASAVNYAMFTDDSLQMKVDCACEEATLLHSEWPKLHEVLATLSALGLSSKKYNHTIYESAQRNGGFLFSQSIP